MTDTTTRRGLKPLLAFLLIGMALLMLGVARPVQGATVNAPYIDFTPGQPAYDAVRWGFNANFTSKNVIVLWAVHETIQYYNAGGPEGSPISVLVTDGYGTGPGDYGGNVPFNGYTTAESNKPSDASGYVWKYSLSVIIQDTNSGQTYATGGAVSPNEEGHGAFPQSGTGEPPPGGHGE